MSDKKAQSKQKKRVPEIDTLLHIVKGAIVRELYETDSGCAVTVSTECSRQTEGRLTIAWNDFNNTPGPEALQRITNRANELIKKNIPVQSLTMKRTEAETRFKDKVNHTFIYDKFKVPDSVDEVTVLLIEDWNVNCCSGKHLSRTGDVRQIKVDRINAREKKKEIEFVFLIADKEQEPKKDQKKTSAPQQIDLTSVDLVKHFSEEILNLTFAELEKEKIDLKGKETQLKEVLSGKIQTSLNLLRNRSYTNGLTSISKTN